MALTREQKQGMVEEYGGGLSEAPHAFLLDYQGITVPQDTELRRKVRATGGDYLVVKNRLALRAIEGRSLAELSEHFQGPTAVAFTDYAKEVPALEFKAGMVDHQMVAGEEIEEIASLPSREDLIAKLLFLLQSPVTRLARGLAAITRDFVVVLDQVREGKEKSNG